MYTAQKMKFSIKVFASKYDQICWKLDTLFMNSEYRKTFDHYSLLLNLSDKVNLKRSDENVALSNLGMYYTWKNIKNVLKNNRFKISAST